MPCRTGPTDHTYYTQVNMTRTIEQILGLPPLNQFDLVASPMLTDFTNTPNFTPLEPRGQRRCRSTHGRDRLGQQRETERAWSAPGMRGQDRRCSSGKTNKADSEDPYTLNHFDWYDATGYTRPYPGESKVRHPSEFAKNLARPDFDD